MERDGFAVEALAERGAKIPEWYEDEPVLPRALGAFTRAFWDLTTERQLGFSVGPIPASKVREYGRDQLGFGGEMLRAFERIIRTMDVRYLKHVSAEAKKNQPKKGGRRKR